MASRHSIRLAKFSDSPGTFIYDGSSTSIEYHPTALKTGKKDPVYDDNGMPILDKAGNQVFQSPGVIKKDANGNVILGGEPKKVEVKLASRTVFGVEFAAGKPVLVSKPELAQKLRCLHGFKEVEAKEIKSKEK